MDVHGSDKQPSLLRYGNNYGCKKFYSTGPGFGGSYSVYIIVGECEPFKLLVHTDRYKDRE